jgi:hypothetical protein
MAPHHGANSIVTRRVPSPRNNAVTRANKAPPPLPKTPPNTPCAYACVGGVCIVRAPLRTEEAADLIASIEIN